MVGIRGEEVSGIIAGWVHKGFSVYGNPRKTLFLAALDTVRNSRGNRHKVSSHDLPPPPAASLHARPLFAHEPRCGRAGVDALSRTEWVWPRRGAEFPGAVLRGGFQLENRAARFRTFIARHLG